MRLQIKIQTTILIAICLCLPLGIYKPATAAGTARLYLSPASGSAVKGDIITADVHVDSGATKIYSVTSAIAFPSSLTWSSYTPLNGYTLVDTNKTVGSVAVLGVTNLSGTTGDVVVATVKFNVVGGSGTANLTFNPVDNANPLNPTASSVKTATPGQPTYTEVLGTTTGSSYSLSGDPVATPPPATPPPSSPPPATPGVTTPTKTSSSAPKTSSSTPSTTKAPAASSSAPAALTISNVTVSGLGPHTATITWQTSIESDSIVEYGLDTTYIAVASDRALVKEHKVTLSSLTLLTDTDYHYRVKSTDANNNIVQSADSTFHTPLISPVAKSTKLPSSQIITAVAVGLIALLGLIIATRHYRKMRENNKDLEYHFPKLPSNIGTGTAFKNHPQAPVLSASALTSTGAPGTTVKPGEATPSPAPAAPKTAAVEPKAPKPKIPAKFAPKTVPVPSSVITPVGQQEAKSKPAAAKPKFTPPKINTKPTVANAEIEPLAEPLIIKAEAKNVKKG